MPGLTRRSFFALFAGLLILPNIKSQARDMRHWQPRIDPSLRKYPLTPNECYHIGVDPIGPPHEYLQVMWVKSDDGQYHIKTTNGKTETGKLVWTKGPL